MADIQEPAIAARCQVLRVVGVVVLIELMLAALPFGLMFAVYALA